MPQTNAGDVNLESKMNLVTSNLQKEDIRTFYAIMLFLFKLKQEKNGDVLATKVELNDLLNMDDKTIELIVKMTDLSTEEIRNMLKHFTIDIKNLLSTPVIPKN